MFAKLQPVVVQRGYSWRDRQSAQSGGRRQESAPREAGCRPGACLSGHGISDHILSLSLEFTNDRRGKCRTGL